jgi:hypothetical protein
MREMARSLNGKDAMMTGLWERKLVTVMGPPRITSRTRVVLINGVPKEVPISGRAIWEVQRKVVEVITAKSISPAPSSAHQLVMPRADAGEP